MKKLLSVLLAVIMVFSTLTAIIAIPAAAEGIVATAEAGGYIIDNGDGRLTAKAYYGNTFLGWYNEADEKAKDTVRRFMNTDGNQIHWDFIRACFGTTAYKAIVPIQDLFGQDGNSRMNVPGVSGGNWGYRYNKELLTDGLAEHLLSVTKLYGRYQGKDDKKENKETETL